MYSFIHLCKYVYNNVLCLGHGQKAPLANTLIIGVTRLLIDYRLQIYGCMTFGKSLCINIIYPFQRLMNITCCLAWRSAACLCVSWLSTCSCCCLSFACSDPATRNISCQIKAIIVVVIILILVIWWRIFTSFAKMLPQKRIQSCI